MGSSGGSSNYKQPTIPTPPNVAGYGSSVPFTPNFVNFLGDPSVPSTGLTPAMLQQIDSGAYAKPVTPPAPADDRNLLAQILAQMQKPQQPQRGWQPQWARNRPSGAQRNSGGR